MQETQINKEAIIAQYLTGDYTLRQLGAKYGIDFRKIHYWVSKYKGKIKPKKKQAKAAEQVAAEQVAAEQVAAEQVAAEQVAVLPHQVKQLQAELAKAKLHNQVLEEMLKLSEQLTGIELRKKFGTKQS